MKNKPLIWILIASLLFMMNTMLIGAVNMYLFKDYFEYSGIKFGWTYSIIAVFIAIPFSKTAYS